MIEYDVVGVATELILGLDIGGTKTAIVVGARTGKVQERIVFASHAARGFQPMFDDLCRETERVLARYPEVDGIGEALGDVAALCALIYREHEERP
jgi:predicted NBD/HSP70 family sugar kinase